MSITNMFFLKIKLLKLGADGKTAMPVYQMADQMIISLNTWVNEFLLHEHHHPNVYQETITQFLAKLSAAWDCPVAWHIEMQTYDDYEAFENPFYVPYSRDSQPFLYSPKDNKTTVDVEFLWTWAMESLQPKAAPAEEVKSEVIH